MEQDAIDPVKIKSVFEGGAQGWIIKRRPPRVENKAVGRLRAAMRKLFQLHAAIPLGWKIIGRDPERGVHLAAQIKLTGFECLQLNTVIPIIIDADAVEI